MNLRKTARFVLTIALAGWWAAAAVSAPKKSNHPDPAVPAVEKVLRAEVAGQVDRRERLAETLAKLPDSSAARWQAGFVHEKNAWRSFDDTESTAAEDLQTYFSRRSDTPQTFQGQLALADWCREHKLPDRERAHLWAALTLSGEGDHSDLVGRLGFFPVGNQWLTREDMERWQKHVHDVLAAMKHWGGRLEKIAEQLEGPPRQRETAMQHLKRLDDPAVIPALEYSLCGREQAALAAVATLARFPEYDATIALAKQAAFSNWPEVRKEAARSLKTRRFEDFVPGLIGLLSTPASLQSESSLFYVENRGWGAFVLLNTYLIARESEDQFHVEIIRTLDNRITELLARSGVAVHFYRKPDPRQFGLILAGRVEQSRTQLDQLHAVESAVDAANERTQELNRRMADVLATVSGQGPAPDISGWWKWWGDYTDTGRSGEKPVVVERVDETTIGDPTVRFRRTSCFAAGTPVWTERGLAPIESIKIGDRVLAQSVETGELAYKPVIKATVRPPKELTTLRIGDETITCTGGHRFWGCGEGWLKARDLMPQVLLHTVTGNTPVASAKPGEVAQTYNLVVDGFHTYFVGKAGLLCQDLLIPSGTDSLVPGLPRARAVAR